MLGNNLGESQIEETNREILVCMCVDWKDKGSLRD